MTKITSQTVKLLSIFIAFLLPFGSFVATAEASSVIRTGDTVSIAEEQVIEGDFYATAGKINISGSIEEDLMVVGGQVTVNGPVGGDGLIIAGQVDIHGTVGDDLRIFSGEVTIAEPIMGNVFLMGGTINMLSTASVGGDVILFAGEATIEGSVGGDVIGNVDTLRIDAQVAGDVDVIVRQLTLGERTNVGGFVRYVSTASLIQAPNALISGETVRNDPVLPMGKSSIKAALVPMLIILFSILVWYWVSRHSLTKVVDRALVMSPRPLLLGFATLVFAPFAIGMLLFSMIGSVIALAALFGYLLLVTLSLIGITAVMGQLLIKAFNRQSASLSLISLGVGVVGVTLLMLLPTIGPVVLIVFMVLTLGSMIDLLIRPNIK